MKTDTSFIPERKKSKPFDPIGTLLNHWMEIAVFGTVLFALALPCALFTSKPYYSVEGRILVSPAVATFIIRNEETPITGYYNAYVRTHVNRIKEEEIIEESLKRLEPELQMLFVPSDLPLTLASSNLLKKVQIFHVPGLIS